MEQRRKTGDTEQRSEGDQKGNNAMRRTKRQQAAGWRKTTGAPREPQAVSDG